MKSTKPVKDLSEISLPYTFTPRRTIDGMINGVLFCFPANQVATLDYPQYEVIRHSDYAIFLEDL